MQELGDRYRISQIKASISVNSEMLRFYWELGKEINELHVNSEWGSKFLYKLSNDLKKLIPNSKCFSISNLRYMKRFYELFSIESNVGIIVPQLGEQLFSIPWGHIKLLIDKCHDDLGKFDFYIDKIVENNWSRAVLLNFLDTDLFERQGHAITNFCYTLPKGTSDLAQEITKDPYNFDFVAIHQGYNEKELKDAGCEKIAKTPEEVIDIIRNIN